jgi:actin-related protein
MLANKEIRVITDNSDVVYKPFEGGSFISSFSSFSEYFVTLTEYKENGDKIFKSKKLD